MSLFTYTDAPESYDYSAARTVVDNVAVTDSGKVIRLVKHDDEYHMLRQRMRYGSGMHMAFTVDQFSEWKDSGFLTVNPESEQKKHYRKTYRIPFAISDDNQHILDAAAEVESIDDVNTDSRCGHDVFMIGIHVVGNEISYNKSCEILDSLLKKQMSLDSLLSEYWNQSSIRHKEEILSIRGESRNWHELSDEEKDVARPMLSDGIRDWLKINF